MLSLSIKRLVFAMRRCGCFEAHIEFYNQIS